MSPPSTPTAPWGRNLSRRAIVAICIPAGLILGFGAVGGALALSGSPGTTPSVTVEPDEPSATDSTLPPDTELVHINDLVEGDCLAISADSESPDRMVPKISCDSQHVIEVIDAYTFPIAEYPEFPSSEIITDKAERQCRNAHDNLPDSPKLTEQPKPYFWSPTRKSWDAGDRVSVCYVALAADNEMVGSVIDGSAAAAE